MTVECGSTATTIDLTTIGLINYGTSDKVFTVNGSLLADNLTDRSNPIRFWAAMARTSSRMPLHS